MGNSVRVNKDYLISIDYFEEKLMLSFDEMFNIVAKYIFLLAYFQKYIVKYNM